MRGKAPVRNQLKSYSASWRPTRFRSQKRSTENRGPSCQQTNAQHHSNNTAYVRKIPAQVDFLPEEILRETKKLNAGFSIEICFTESDTAKCKETTNHLQGYRKEVLRKISAVKSRTKIASESMRQTLAQIGAICRHELRFAPRWVRISPPKRILDEIWRRDRKNEHRIAKKPILRKAASRTNETVPGLEKCGTLRPFTFYTVPATMTGRLQT